MESISRKKFGKNGIIALGVGIILQGQATAQEFNQPLRFAEVWLKVRSESPAIKEQSSRVEEAAIGSERAHRHWWPRLGAEAKALSTNDSMLGFMSLLGQRALVGTDFDPTQLNEPGRVQFQTLSLGVDLPLYEGGMKVAMSRVADSSYDAQVAQREALVLQKKGETANLYLQIYSHQRRVRDLSKLKQELGLVLRSYGVGSRSNPVGYSGLLGLRTLENRIEALILESRSTGASLKGLLQSDADSLSSDWSTPEIDLGEWFEKEFTESVSPKGTVKDGTPAGVQALQYATQAQEHAKSAQMARFLPRVGVFARAGLTRGERETAHGYTAGAYLQWELFNSESLGVISQAEKTVASWEAKTDGMRRKLISVNAASREGLDSALQSLVLLEKNSTLMTEQTQTARGLFQSGAINALQLTEVYSRRVDLVIGRSEVERAFANALENWVSTSTAPDRAGKTTVEN